MSVTLSQSEEVIVSVQDRAAGAGIPGPEASKQSPRDRLLAAASELFYAEGVHSVGIDRVIARAGVAKASLYSTFGSKEGLVSAYLDESHRRQLGRRRAAAEAAADPRSAILAIFDSLAEDLQRPDYNGCAFAGARAEAPAGGQIDEAARSYRADIRALLCELCAEAGATAPDRLAYQLQMLYSGGAEAAKLDHDPEVAIDQRMAVEALLTAALGS